MHNILVSIEADLPSSIALRYACRLAELTEAKVQVIHVKEPDEAGPAVGAGWARLTWQKELLAGARKEITQLLRDEFTRCASLADPIVAVGDRKDHVLAELGRHPYDLLVEGLPAPADAAELHHTLRSQIIPKIHCPVLLALTMVPLDRVLVCLDSTGLSHVECFGRLLAKTDLSVDLVFLEFSENGNDGGKGRSELALAEARQILSDLGLRVMGESVRRGRSEDLSNLTEDYGMLVVPLLHEPHREQAWTTILNNTSTSILLC